MLLLIGLAGYDRVKVRSIQVKESKIPIETDIQEYHIYLGSDGWWRGLLSTQTYCSEVPIHQ